MRTQSNRFVEGEREREREGEGGRGRERERERGREREGEEGEGEEGRGRGEYEGREREKEQRRGDVLTCIQQLKIIGTKLLPILETLFEEKCAAIADFYDPTTQSMSSSPLLLLPIHPLPPLSPSLLLFHPKELL